MNATTKPQFTAEDIEALLEGTTPGPWSFSDGGITAAEGEYQIADVHPWNGDGNHTDEAKEAAKNARLIADAPDLARLAASQARELADLRADRDSWCNQAHDRVKDWDEMRQRAETAERALAAANERVRVLEGALIRSPCKCHYEIDPCARCAALAATAPASPAASAPVEEPKP